LTRRKREPSFETEETEYGELRLVPTRVRWPGGHESTVLELHPDEMRKLPAGAIRADVSKQVFGLGGPHLFYVDRERRCRSLRRHVRLRRRGAAVLVREVRELRLERIELVDGAGRTVATAATELELRRVPPGRSQQDFSRYDTQDFDGLVPTGETVRLWMHGRLDRDFSAIMSTTPARYRATLVTADGARLAVEGPLDPPWPTA
jgi:hypothetical protein